ncbi:hypothetical protein [Trueperella pyogenes]
MTTFALDTLPLDDPDGRYRIEKSTSLPRLSIQENQLITAPFMDGALAVRGATPTRPFALSMWIPNPAGMSHDVVIDMASFLGLAFSQAKTLRMIPEKGEARIARILAVRASDTVMTRSRHGATIVFDLDLAPYWQSEAVYLSAQTDATPSTVIPNFDGITGPALDAVFRLTGRFASATITDPQTGSWLTASKPLESSDYLFVDAATGRTWRSPALSAWEPPQKTDLAKFGPGGIPKFWPTLNPSPDQYSPLTSLVVKISTTNGTAPKLVIRGHKWYI